MIKYYILFLAFLLSTTILAQGEADHWYFGSGAGLIFDHENGTVMATDAARGTIDTNEGCSSISSPNGDLLFYTDGRSVWDRNYNIMPNANYNSGQGLLGDSSSTASAIACKPHSLPLLLRASVCSVVTGRGSVF